MDDLYVFDGNCKLDVINDITMDYHRVTKINPGQSSEGATWKFEGQDARLSVSMRLKAEMKTCLKNLMQRIYSHISKAIQG